MKSEKARFISKSKTKTNTCFPSMTLSFIVRNYFTETLICNSFSAEDCWVFITMKL